MQHVGRPAVSTCCRFPGGMESGHGWRCPGRREAYGPPVRSAPVQYDRLVTGLAGCWWHHRRHDGAGTSSSRRSCSSHSPSPPRRISSTSTRARRLAARVYRTVERQAAVDSARSRGRQRTGRRSPRDTGAGPREDWTPPRDGATARKQRLAGHRPPTDHSTGPDRPATGQPARSAATPATTAARDSIAPAPAERERRTDRGRGLPDARTRPRCRRVLDRSGPTARRSSRSTRTPTAATRRRSRRSPRHTSG